MKHPNAARPGHGDADRDQGAQFEHGAGSDATLPRLSAPTSAAPAANPVRWWRPPSSLTDRELRLLERRWAGQLLRFLEHASAGALPTVAVWECVDLARQRLHAVQAEQERRSARARGE